MEFSCDESRFIFHTVRMRITLTPKIKYWVVRKILSVFFLAMNLFLFFTRTAYARLTQN